MGVITNRDEISNAARGFVNGINQPGRGAEVKTAVNTSFEIFMNKCACFIPAFCYRLYWLHVVILHA
jgi:hypothetical protein